MRGKFCPRSTPIPSPRRENGFRVKTFLLCTTDVFSFSVFGCCCCSDASTRSKSWNYLHCSGNNFGSLCISRFDFLASLAWAGHHHRTQRTYHRTKEQQQRSSSRDKALSRVHCNVMLWFRDLEHEASETEEEDVNISLPLMGQGIRIR